MAICSEIVQFREKSEKLISEEKDKDQPAFTCGDMSLPTA